MDVKSFPIENWLSGSSSHFPDCTVLNGLDQLGKAMVLSSFLLKGAQCTFVIFPSQHDARNAIDNIQFFASKQNAGKIFYIPPFEFDYYRGLLLSPEKLAERNVSLFHLMNDPTGKIFVTTVSSALQKTFVPEEYLKATHILKPNDEIDRDDFIRKLVEAGYQRQPSSLDPGSFSIRGGVIDVFCPLNAKPFRIELFGDLIEEIRFFDPKTQLSEEKIDEAIIIPVGISLVPHSADFEKAHSRIKERLDNLGVSRTKRDVILDSVKNGVIATDSSYLFPLLSNGSASLFDYLPKNAAIFWDGKDKCLETAKELDYPRFQSHHSLFEKGGTAIAGFSDLFLTLDELKNEQDKKGSIAFESFESHNVQSATLESEQLTLKITKDAPQHIPIDTYSQKLKAWMELGYRVHIICHTQNHADRVEMLFEPHHLSCKHYREDAIPLNCLLNSDFTALNLWLGYIGSSRVFPTLKLILISEEELFGAKKRAAKSSSWTSSDPARLLSHFRDLKVGDYIVHKEFGIGKYLGLKSMDFQGMPNDYVLLEYKDGDKLYIPVYRLNVIQKYVGGENTNVAVDKLGGESWKKTKSKAQRAVAELAEEFLRIHAKRKLIPAHSFSKPGNEYMQFEMGFPFDETPDQLRSIQDVMKDLSKHHPMDRLICGDVGYGKTEVAMRAAFRAVIDNKQVAVLVPTTVLAFQHYENFKKRFNGSAARIEIISRMRSPQENKKTLELLKEGKVDVIIGTHRLISPDVEFKDLGLLIIDEEHRFGVVHKEKLKKMSESIHVLSMTATPIPRTLNMAMAGIKDISIITTPPPDRLAVRTFVCRESDEIIKEALTNELAREGQIYFVHNRIESIFEVAERLKRLVPKLTCEVVHGQMDGEELERKMLSFYKGEFQVLLTTTIIESGLDIPLANTIIIDRADHFGLAQLYQLRGRVGRSERRAYCYLLIPSENLMTDDAKERLQVIQRYTELGSGFHIASHDLEIRGTGDMLGKDQSGHLNAIGVDLYFELLEEALRSLKGEAAKIEIEPEINLRLAAFFPSDYLPDISERLSIYRKMSEAENEETISEIETEIRDRFGTPPEEVLNLLGLMTIKVYLKKLHVVRMNSGPKKTSIQFADSTPASPEKLVKLVQASPKLYQLTPDGKFVFSVQDTGWKAQLTEIKRLAGLLKIDSY